MATWKLDTMGIQVAIAREVTRQGVDPSGEGEASTEQVASIRDAAESVAWAFATDFDGGDQKEGDQG